MKLFKLFKKIDSESLKNKLIKKNAAKNSILFVVGTLISALAFNLFLVPNSFVTGGLNGLAIIIRNFIPSVTNTMVLIFGNLLFVILSIITMGWKESVMSALGAIFYVIFVSFETRS